MKDLKHLYYFEKLLEDANNELVRKAQDKGELCIGSVCENIPEPLLNLPGTFSIRLRAPRTGSMEMATYYMTSFLCEYTRALLERALEGGYNFLDALIAPDGCTMMNRCVENMELLKTCNKEKFFNEFLEIPLKANDNGLNLYKVQCENHILKPLKENYGIDTSDDALLTAIQEHNQVCKLINEIGEYRKEEKPRITGYEFHIITMVSYCVPKKMIIKELEETLEELKTRVPDDKNKYRARVVLVGSEVDDVDVVKLIEESGAYVCADRFCYGSFPGRQEIEIKDGESPLEAICRHYMYASQCVRYMDQSKIQERRQYVKKLAEDFSADGVIYEQMKFCDPWAYERMVGTHVLRDEMGYPVLSIDRPYAVGMSGQIRTRVQAFVESIEIKKIQGGIK